MGLCGSFRCGCGVTTDGSIVISGSGEPDDPYVLSIPPEEPGIPDPDPVVTAWVNPTLLNSWEDWGSGQQEIQYRMVDDLVHIRGIGFGVAGVIFTLPVGYRPPALVSFPVLAVVGGDVVIAVLEVQTDGDVFTAYNNSYMSFGTIMFSTTA